jgi:hypothetical protein
MVKLGMYTSGGKQNATEHPHAQWRTSTLTTAIANCLVGRDLQTGHATDDSDI